MVSIQIWIAVLLIMIWFQTVRNGYQQMTKAIASKERIKKLDCFFNLVINHSYTSSVYNASIRIADIIIITLCLYRQTSWYCRANQKWQWRNILFTIVK